MKIFRQRMLACVLAALIFAGAAVGKDIPVQAAGRAGGAPSDILVVYFSCTENTKAVAEHAADILKADIYEIVPEVPYTPEDLNYGNSSSRTSLENNDPDARPGISGSVENMAGYGTVLIGYPIWHGKAPKIIYTFLESYDFSGKTILPFCTSASSPLGTSASNLHVLCDSSVKWLDGKRFGAGTSRETVESWLSDMGIPSPDEGECEHSYTEEVTAEPTCTAEGQKTCTCSLCGDSYTVSLCFPISRAIRWPDSGAQSRTFPSGLGQAKGKAGSIPGEQARRTHGAGRRTHSWNPWPKPGSPFRIILGTANASCMSM